MIYKVPYDDIEALDPNLSLWQYMPFEYFKILLEKSQLFFKRCDLFHDKNEGVISKAHVDKIHKDEASKEIADALITCHDNVKKWHFASCWHQSKIEASNMWAQYANKDGIAIQTTVGALNLAITDEKTIVIGSVNYVDSISYIPENNDAWLKLLIKQKEYSNENEVRLLYRDNIPAGILNDDYHSKNESINIDVNLSEMILKIVASPNSNDEVCEEIYNLLKFNKINPKLLEPSKMNAIR